MWTFDIIHVKGEGTYGLPRTVPLHPDVREILSLYLILRKKWLVDNNLNSHALFPSKNGADGYLSGNAIRRIKAVVEDDLNVKFDLRMCRRTFGQRYLDSDVDIESVSVLMGHASTKTISDTIRNKFHFIFETRAENIDDKDCIIIDVPEGDSIVDCDGRFYFRVGNTTQQLEDIPLKRILLDEMGIQWLDQPCKVDLENISEDAFRFFMKKGKEAAHTR